MGGGEVSELHVLDVATGEVRPDVIERIWGEFTADWLPDGSGFFYTRMAPAQEGVDPILGMTTWLHVLGEPGSSDVQVLGGEQGAMPMKAEELTFVEVPAGSSAWMVAFGAGARRELRVSVAKLADLDRTGAGKTPWKAVAEYADGIYEVAIHGERLYLQSVAGAANGRVLSVPLAHPDLAQARIEVAEDSEAVITGMAVSGDALYVSRAQGSQSEVLRKAWKGADAKGARALPLPFDGTVDRLVTDQRADGAWVRLEGWTHAAGYYAVDIASRSLTGPVLSDESTADFSGVVVEEVDAVNPDGTAIPLTILRRGDLALDGTAPTIVRGYGAYGRSNRPSFDPTWLPWLARGGVMTVCHVRGGGEKGHQWQLDGSLEHKMNGVHDLEACAQYLIDRGYTGAARVAARGASAGGILVGRAVTDRPDLFAAVWIAAGEVNPIRMLHAENGANQKADLGDPETEAGFRSILEIDPYQHIAAGVAYPAMLFSVGLNDHRVPPWASAKMVARLQVSTTSGKPILLRVDGDAGHGAGSTRDQDNAATADVYAFLLQQLGGAAASVHD